MSKNVILLILLTLELWEPLAVIAQSDVSSTPDGLDVLPICGQMDKGTLATGSTSCVDDSAEGSAYNYIWVKFNGGVKLECDSLVAVQLLKDHEIDTSKHGFPGIQAKIIPAKVNVGDNLEVWYHGSLHRVSVESHLLIANKFGRRTIWGAVPAFHFDFELIPGSPIFRDGKLVSIITKSDGKGKYAVGGISNESGHILSNEVRVRTMGARQAVYGGMIGSYAEIKNEAMRVKEVDNETNDKYEIIVGVNTLRLVGWRGDNVETFHTRIGSVPNLTCGVC